MNHILNRLSAKPRTSTAFEQSPTANAAISPKKKLRRIVGKASLTIISTALTFSIVLGADLYLHHRHGINPWGYRGPAVGQKQPGEKRLAVLGGSTAWGYGLAAAQSFPGQLQQRLAERFPAQAGPPIKVLNLAFNNEGAYSFKYTLRDYDYLDYDLVLFYSGYNDLGVQNLFVFRHRSPIFVWTGYLPLLPNLIEDRLTWRNRPSKENNPIVFTPPNLNQGSETREQTSRRLGQLTQSGQSNDGVFQGTCPTEWQFYCHQMYEVTDAALRQGKRVLVVTEPYISDKHVEQQRALEGMLSKRFEGQANFRYLNLGRAVDLRDPSLCWDGMHLTDEGNRRITEALTQPVLDLLQR